MSYRSIQVIGAEEAVEMFTESAVKLEDMRYAQPLINQLLSITYHRKWRAWNGYLYDTGRLMRSWTALTRTTDALRSAHYDHVEYGSSVPYGRFYSGQILEVNSKGVMDVTEAMADYYAGVRVVAGYVRGDVAVRSHVRRSAAAQLAAAHQ